MMSFNYTNFLNKQNEVYLSKYTNDPIQLQKTLKPVAGYSGFKPTYRGSTQQLRVIRSLLRCLDKEELQAKNTREQNSVPSTSYSCGSKSTKISSTSESPESRTSSSISHRSLTPENFSDPPRGSSRTLYGQSFGFNWSNEKQTDSNHDRVKEAEREKNLNSNHGIIYRKHGCIIPKYQGHVPNYKFRHGASFAALTFNPTIKRSTNDFKEKN